MFQHFGTDEEGLGNPGRIPPTLDGVGAKLRPEWLRKVLFDGAAVRPYMHTRMPQFGEANLRHLPGLFEKVDSFSVVEALKKALRPPVVSSPVSTLPKKRYIMRSPGLPREMILPYVVAV